MHKETKHHNTDKSIYPKPKQMFNCVGFFDVINSVKYGKHKTKFSSYIKSTSFLQTLFAIWRSLKRESFSWCCVGDSSVVISSFYKVCLLSGIYRNRLRGILVTFNGSNWRLTCFIYLSFILVMVFVR